MGNESKVIYKHTVFVNINNRVVRHIKEVSADNIKPGSEEAYTVKYNKVTEMFRCVIYNYDQFENETNMYILKTFRNHCDSISTAFTTSVLSKKVFSEV
jgi:hypothetical protein